MIANACSSLNRFRAQMENTSTPLVSLIPKAQHATVHDQVAEGPTIVSLLCIARRLGDF